MFMTAAIGWPGKPGSDDIRHNTHFFSGSRTASVRFLNQSAVGQISDTVMAQTGASRAAAESALTKVFKAREKNINTIFLKFDAIPGAHGSTLTESKTKSIELQDDMNIMSAKLDSTGPDLQVRLQVINYSVKQLQDDMDNTHPETQRDRDSFGL